MVAWARIDDHYFQNPKVTEAGPEGRFLHLASIVYACGHGKGGLIRESALPLLMLSCGVKSDKAIRALVDRLVAVGLWDVAAEGWEIHDFGEFQPGNPTALGRAGGVASGKSRRAQRDARNIEETGEQN